MLVQICHLVFERDSQFSDDRLYRYPTVRCGQVPVVNEASIVCPLSPAQHRVHLALLVGRIRHISHRGLPRKLRNAVYARLHQFALVQPIGFLASDFRRHCRHSLLPRHFPNHAIQSSQDTSISQRPEHVCQRKPTDQDHVDSGESVFHLLVAGVLVYIGQSQ